MSSLILEETTVNSIKEYIEVVTGYPNAYFRGQADGENWKLLPKLARIVEDYNLNLRGDYGSWSGLEEDLLQGLDVLPPLIWILILIK